MNGFSLTSVGESAFNDRGETGIVRSFWQEKFFGSFAALPGSNPGLNGDEGSPAGDYSRQASTHRSLSDLSRLSQIRAAWLR